MSTSPSSKHLLTSILIPLKKISPPPPPTANVQTHPNSHQNILNSLPEPDLRTTKSTLLTLHFLFPHELLPALDLIDRKLIIHLGTKPGAPPAPPSCGITHDLPQHDAGANEVYYVQSASSTTSADAISSSTTRKGRFRNALSRPGQFYEVRLDSWNCSCPAFAFSSLKLLMRSSSAGVGDGGQEVRDRMGRLAVGGEERKECEWLMGGVATKEDAMMPVCKHILAVVLTKAAPGLFGTGLSERKVSVEEIAGWAAGWGDH